jgi:hypothetical protein
MEKTAPYEIKPASDRAKNVRLIFGRCVRSALACMGVDIAGFALVVWDMRGEVRTAYLTEYGLVGRSLMPTYVHDALQRHVTKDVIEECTSEQVTGD